MHKTTIHTQRHHPGILNRHMNFGEEDKLGEYNYTLVTVDEIRAMLDGKTYKDLIK